MGMRLARGQVLRARGGCALSRACAFATLTPARGIARRQVRALRMPRPRRPLLASDGILNREERRVDLRRPYGRNIALRAPLHSDQAVAAFPRPSQAI